MPYGFKLPGTDVVKVPNSGGGSDPTKLPLAGGTLSGLLNFSGTTHAGIRLNSLTTTQRNALTAGVGDFLLNTTLNQLQGYVSGAWVSLATLGANTFTSAQTFDATTGAIFPGSTSGNATVKAPAIAGTSVITLPGITSTLAILGANTFTGQQIISTNGAASTPPLLLNGTIFTGGSATTTKPQFLVEPTGTTSNNWSTGGTGLGVNAASGFAGNVVDFQLNGSSKFAVSSDMNIGWTAGGSTMFIPNFGGVGRLGLLTGSNCVYLDGSNNMAFGSTYAIGWTSAFSYSTGVDLKLCRAGAAMLQMGSDAAGVTNQHFKACNRITSNGVGANLTISGGNGRGGAGGSLILATYDTGASATPGTLLTRLTLDTDGVLTFANGVNLSFASTMIGAANTDALAFWGTSPVTQPAHIADPTGDSGTGLDTVDKTVLDTTLTDIQTAITSINAMLAQTGLTAAT